jgi:hypothetical protein
MATATSNHRPDHARRRRRHALAAIATAAAVAAAGTALAITALASPERSPGRGFPALAPAAAPEGWRHLALPNRTAVLSYPPALHQVASDTDAVSVARLSPPGTFQLYLNATPRQGSENLRTWAAFRLRLLRADDAASAHQIAAARGVMFRGGTGACVLDTYLTRIGHHQFTEIACLVHGHTSASVIVAAAPAAQWAQARTVLLRAVAAYQVR